MKIPLSAPLDLLHRCAFGILATHLREPAGFPYPTVLPFAPDARHRPVFLISRLAEHTRNLEADPRAGLAVCQPEGADVLNTPRLSLIGHVQASAADPDLLRRYVRYQPGAERYLALGDFSFVTLNPERLRYIGGFGAMGWLEGTELTGLTVLDAAAEQHLLDQFDALKPAHVSALGLDYYGIDLLIGATRVRMAFEPEPDGVAAVWARLADLLQKLR